MNTSIYNSDYINEIAEQLDSQPKDSCIPELEQIPLVMSVPELAKVLGIGRNSATKLVKSGAIKCFYAGTRIRIPRSALLEFLGM